MVVVPAFDPVTTPDVPILAITGDTELHVPPGTASLSVVVAPGHRNAVPVIAPELGKGLIVTTVVAAAVPQILVTV